MQTAKRYGINPVTLAALATWGGLFGVSGHDDTGGTARMAFPPKMPKLSERPATRYPGW